MSADTSFIYAHLHKLDHPAVGDFLDTRDGQWLTTAPSGRTALTRAAVEHAPPLTPCTPGASLFELMDRLRCRRRLMESSGDLNARSIEDLHRATEDVISAAEYVAANTGSTVFVSDIGKPYEPDMVLRCAGNISEIAFNLLGIAPITDEADDYARSNLLDLVKAIADAESAELVDRIGFTVSLDTRCANSLAPAGRDVWARRRLAHQIARAAVTYCDAAQLGLHWGPVEAAASIGVAALLSLGDIGSGTGLELPDRLAIVKLLNRAGISFRARYEEPNGLWFAEQAANFHLASIAVLGQHRPPNKRGLNKELTRRFMVLSFTSITNLASAWTEKNSMVDLEADDSELRRAATLLRAIRDPSPPHEHKVAHDALHNNRRCPSPDRCLPLELIQLNISGTASNYRKWNCIIMNDLAEINWRIFKHELFDRLCSRWSARNRGSAVTSSTCRDNALELHENALRQLSEYVIEAARQGRVGDCEVYSYWRWVHQRNLRDKLSALLNVDKSKVSSLALLQVDRERLAARLAELEESLPVDEPPHQLATLDAYETEMP